MRAKNDHITQKKQVVIVSAVIRQMKSPTAVLSGIQIIQNTNLSRPGLSFSMTS